MQRLFLRLSEDNNETLLTFICVYFSLSMCSMPGEAIQTALCILDKLWGLFPIHVDHSCYHILMFSLDIRQCVVRFESLVLLFVI